MTRRDTSWNWMRSGAAAMGLGAILAVAGVERIAEPAERTADRAFVSAAVVAELAAQPEIGRVELSGPTTPAAAVGAQEPIVGERVAGDRIDREEWRLASRPGDGYVWSRGHEGR